MANTTDPRSGLQIFLQKKASTRLQNTLFNVMPTLEFLCALNGGDKTGSIGLGRPKTGILVGALNGVAAANREKIMAERQYLPIVQTTKPSKTDVKAMGDRDNDPTVPGWESAAAIDWFTQPVFKFARKKMPYKIAHSDVRTARDGASTEGVAAKAINSVYDAEVKTRTAVLCEVINDELWGVNGSQGYPTSQTAVTWDHMFSIQNALKADNNYGGVDRSLSANSWWRGNYDTTTRSWTFEDLINYCNYDLGMISKGLGVQIIAVGGTLMKKAKAEAKGSSYQLMTNGIPEYPEFGFKREVVRIYSGNRPVYVYFDPAIPDVAQGAATNHLAALDPSTWTVAIAPDGNFKISTPADQTKVEGGDEADTGTINTELLLACEVPSGNAYFTDFAGS